MFNLGFPKDWSTLRKLIYFKKFGFAGGSSDPLITLSGSLVRFTSSKSKPFVSTEVNIVPQQSGSGDPSPSNVRPISGWTEVNVTRTGKNLFDKDNLTALDGKYLNNLTIANGGGNKGFILPCKGNTEYTMSLAVKNNTDVTVGWFTDYPDTGSVATGKKALGTYETGSFTFTTGADVKYLFVKYNSTNITQTYTNQQVLDGIMLNIGDTATAYTPYNGTTTTIPLGSTVYGGTLTINEDGSGELTVDSVVVDLKELSFTRESRLASAGGYYFNSNTSKNVIPECLLLVSEITKAQVQEKCEFAKVGNAYSVVADLFWVFQSGDNVTIRVGLSDSTIDTKEKFDTFINGLTNSKVLYPLATPIVTTLTAQQINTLVGENNVWADSGDIEVTVYGTEIVEPDLNALQSLNILLGNRYINNHEVDEPTDEEALQIIMGETR